jgi:DNA processing protein
MDDRIYKLAISFIEKVAPADLLLLIERLGSAEALFHDHSWSTMEDINPAIFEKIRHSDALSKAAKEYEYAEQHGYRIILYDDPDFPIRLTVCPDAPLVLYCKGSCPLNATRILAIVGTRKPTFRGKKQTEELVERLAKEDPSIIIVSGLAYGIDVTAHQAALQQGLQTIGVLAHGFNYLYPPSHRSIALEMIKQGGLLTELPYFTPAVGWRFLHRNRIIASISDACVVIESGVKGGSIATATYALQYGREVFAYPGRATDEQSRGCNLLIKRQTASLVDSTEDILTALSWQSHSKKRSNQPELFNNLAEKTPLQQQITQQMTPDQPVTIEQLIQQTGLPLSTLLPELLQLEMNQALVSLPGNRYLLNQ